MDTATSPPPEEAALLRTLWGALGRHRALVAVTVLGALVEAVGLRAVHLTSVVGMAPQATATPPFGVYHDLRWVLTYHNSWPGFAGALFALLAVRSVLDTALARLAWPVDVAKPTLLRHFTATVVFVAVAVVVLSPWAVLAFAGAGTSLSWFIFGELIPVVVLALIMHRGAIMPSWWRRLPPLRTVGWALFSFVILTFDALVIGLTPGWGVVPVAGATALFNALAWRRTVDTAVRTELSRIPVPATPLATVAVTVLMLGIGSYAVGHSQSQLGPPPGAHVNSPVGGAGKPVLLVDGFNTTYDGGVRRSYGPNFATVRFSYAGLGPAGRPLPYGADATHQSLDKIAGLLATQVTVLHRRTGQPVAIVAASEGTLVTRIYLDATADAPVDTFVMLSPLVRPARVYYPPSGTSHGWGIATGWELREMLALIRLESGADLTADLPFVRSVLTDAPRLRNEMMCPIPGVQVVAFLPLASASVVPPGHLSSVPVVELPGFHAELMTHGHTHQLVEQALAGKAVATGPSWRYTVIRDATAAWQAPPLSLAANPVWHYRGGPDASFGANGCRPPRR